jgi:hypothetical protein
MRQPSPNAWYGFMAFMADAPMCGLRHQPSWSPMWQPNATTNGPKPTGVDGWVANYSASKDRFALEREASDSADSMDAAHAEDPDEDYEPETPDDVMPVAIEPDGTLFVYAEAGDDEPLVVYTAAEVYAAYGMTAP